MSASSAEPFVTVVVPTYNRAEMLGVTLESLLRQSYANYEIIVVDNNSSDSTQAVIGAWQKNARVPVIGLFEPRQGVHYARNSAFERGKGEIFYFTDDDMVADAELLREIVKPFAYDDRVAAVTGPVLPTWLEQPPDWILYLCSNYLLSLQKRDELLLISPNDCGVMSCHQAVRREAFDRAGGYNPENTAGEWLGDGETGLNLRLKELGYWFAYTASSITHHMIPASRMTQAYLNERLANQGNCDSYTDYRRERYTRTGLAGRILLHGGAMLAHGVRFLGKAGLNRGSWRLERARIDYYRNRIRYDARLITDEGWRKMVLKTDWLHCA